MLKVNSAQLLEHVTWIGFTIQGEKKKKKPDMFKKCVLVDDRTYWLYYEESVTTR